MKLEHRNLAYIGAAALLLVVLIALPVRHSNFPSSVPASAHPIAAVADDKGADADAPLLLEQRERRQQVEWARDPFSAALSGTPVRASEPRASLATARSPVPTLRGISICGDDRRALIDREIVQPGDRLASGYSVGKITARSVTLTRDQEELVLSLGDQP